MIHINLRGWPYISWREGTVPSRTIGWIALTVCILSASTYNSFAKILTGSLSPLSLFFLSEFLTGFFVIFSFGLMPVLRALLKTPLKLFIPLVCIGLTNGTIAPLLLFAGLGKSTAVNASLFVNTEMLFLLLLAVFILREKFRKEHFLSAATIVAGLLVIALRGFTEGIQLYAGDVLLVLSAFSFAVGSTVFRRYLHRMQPQVILFVRSSVAVTCFFLISPFITHPLIEEMQAFPLILIPVLLGFGFISRFLNIFSFYEALDRLPMTAISLVNNLGVITSVLFASWLLGEAIHSYHIIGGALIILGAVILEVGGVHPSKALHEAHHRTRGPRA